MKSRFIRLWALLMAFQVFVSSTGFAIIEHSCPIKGKQIFLFSNPKKCCFVRKSFKNSGLSFSRTECCKDKSTFVKINTDAKSQHQDTNPSGQCDGVLVFAQIIPLYDPYLLGACLRVSDFYPEISPPHGRKLLTQIQIFQI